MSSFRDLPLILSAYEVIIKDLVWGNCCFFYSKMLLRFPFQSHHHLFYRVFTVILFSDFAVSAFSSLSHSSSSSSQMWGVEQLLSKSTIFTFLNLFHFLLNMFLLCPSFLRLLRETSVNARLQELSVGSWEIYLQHFCLVIE